MKNGLYKVEFATPLGSGAGVVTLNDGHIAGGDSSMYYVGTYNLDGNNFSGQVQTNKHTVGLESVFGKDRVSIDLSGTFEGNNATMTGTSKEAPDIGFQARLLPLAD